MAVSELHRKIALAGLAAAAGFGFALGGGNALLAHGIITRSTQDVDLFTNQEHGVETAAGAVEAALRAAGFRAERQDEAGDLADLFPDIGEGLAEWIVTSPDGEQTVLQLAYFDRSREPVWTELGPVLSVEDVAGGKVCALASRVEPRDYADTARMLERYTPAELISFASRLDPGLTGRDFADAAGSSTAWVMRGSHATACRSATWPPCGSGSRPGRAPPMPPRNWSLASPPAGTNSAARQTSQRTVTRLSGRQIPL